MTRYCVWVSGQPLLAPAQPGSGAATWGISPDPSVERAQLAPGDHLWLMSPSLPLWLAEGAATRLRVGRRWSQWRVWIGRRRIRRFLAFFGRDAEWIPPSAIAPGSSADVDTLTPGRIDSILSILRNRQLLADEVQAAWRELALDPPIPSAVELHQLVLAGFITRQAAVGLGIFGRLECRRCGSTDAVYTTWCERCGGECPQCLDCLNLGIARGCSALFSVAPKVEVPGNERHEPAPKLHLPFELSLAQTRAATEIQQAIGEGIHYILVWAACGAGKTEVIYGAIEEALARQQRVLLTTPRRDVAADLHRRLQAVFGAHVAAGLYGGAAQKYPETPVLVATTHQAIRLAGFFALMVLDECDAFPYTDTPMLQRAIARLGHQAGCFIQMTATPSRKMQEQACRSGSRLVYIPARHHGHPLPVPQIQIDKSLRRWSGRDGLALPSGLQEAYEQTRREGAQLLIFVPRRMLVAPVVRMLKAAGVPRVMGVHSRSGTRDAVRDALTTGALDAVVATTVFERGLTFPTANVAVLFADAQQVFDTASLIQMAGRVGRTAERPSGRVWFLCRKRTRQVEEAVKAIAELNAIAEARGLLRTLP